MIQSALEPDESKKEDKTLMLNYLEQQRQGTYAALQRIAQRGEGEQQP
jgi:hypothetical protein